jgi:hypothetical protein
VSANKSNKNDANVVTNSHNQTIGIAFDIEDNTVIRNDTGITISRLNINRALPISMRRLVVPSFQCFFVSG